MAFKPRSASRARKVPPAAPPHQLRHPRCPSLPPGLLPVIFVLLPLALAATAASAQISLTTAVDLALRNSPRVLTAEAEVRRAAAGLSEARDVYIPSVVAGSGLGYSYGFPLGQPSIYNFTAQSLVFNYSQHDYIRSARSSLDGANLSLIDARLGVAEDAAVTFLALDRDAQREAALAEQAGFAARLTEIVQARLDAGKDSPINLTTARLTAAQVRLALLRAQDDAATDRLHLAHLTGLPVEGLSPTHEDLPTLQTSSASAVGTSNFPDSPAVQAAFAVAKAKREIAFGDSRYLWRPLVTFAAQYSRYASYNGYENYYKSFQHNNFAIGVQITLPLLDVGRKAKSRESIAEADHFLYDARVARDQAGEGRLRLQRSTAELAARAEIASLDQQLAQQQLEILRVQLQAGNPGGPQLSPKDEQNSRIAEREKFLSVLDTTYQLHQAQINLLRQTGQLEPWLKSLSASPLPATPHPATPFQRP